MELRHFRLGQKIFKMFLLSCPKMPRLHARSRLYDFGTYVMLHKKASKLIPTLGVWPFTFPARANEPWTLPTIREKDLVQKLLTYLTSVVSSSLQIITKIMYEHLENSTNQTWRKTADSKFKDFSILPGFSLMAAKNCIFYIKKPFGMQKLKLLCITRMKKIDTRYKLLPC